MGFKLLFMTLSSNYDHLHWEMVQHHKTQIHSLMLLSLTLRCHMQHVEC